jgi:hypothetical protein
VIDDPETLAVFVAMGLVTIVVGALMFVAGVMAGWAL